MVNQRERHQLVVSLGEGAVGAGRRRAFEIAAEREQKPVTVWARHALCKVALLPADEVVTRDEFEALEARVRKLERQ
jgi:hypothetical protein